MMDLQDTARLSQTFARQAQIPDREIMDAKKFLTTLAKGNAPADAIVTGGKILQSLEEKMEVYAFSAAVLAGQESTDDKALGKKLDDIDTNIANVEKTTAHLKKALAAFSNA
jgi:hypothetical protein